MVALVCAGSEFPTELVETAAKGGIDGVGTGASGN